MAETIIGNIEKQVCGGGCFSFDLLKRKHSGDGHAGTAMRGRPSERKHFPNLCAQPGVVRVGDMAVRVHWPDGRLKTVTSNRVSKSPKRGCGL